jgi:hypothetical protein
VSSNFFGSFPRLDPANRNWRAVSPNSPAYNCIAWAVGDTHHWWQPTIGGGFYWPDAAPLEPTVDAYRIALETQGFAVCISGDLEPGYEKVALFAVGGTDPTHAARQLPNGQWTSKLGQGIDIDHASPEDVGGGRYGEIVLFLMRAVKDGGL